MLVGIAVLAAIPDRLGSVFRRDNRTGLRKLVFVACLVGAIGG